MTNSNLIPVFNGLIANQPVQLCDARELHAFVESKRQYANWIAERISDYGFVQDEDYIIVTQRTNGRPRKEYHITLDMGKELAMVERNKKGRMVRKYFIECERKVLQQPKQLALPEPLQPGFTDRQVQLLGILVRQMWYQTGVHYNAIYERIKRHYGVGSLSKLPTNKFEEIMALAKEIGLQFKVQNNTLPVLPSPKKALDTDKIDDIHRYLSQAQAVIEILNNDGADLNEGFTVAHSVVMDAIQNAADLISAAKTRLLN